MSGVYPDDTRGAHPSPLRLMALADNEVPNAAERSAIESHLIDCAECRAVFAEIRADRGAATPIASVWPAAAEPDGARRIAILTAAREPAPALAPAPAPVRSMWREPLTWVSAGALAASLLTLVALRAVIGTLDAISSRQERAESARPEAAPSESRRPAATPEPSVSAAPARADREWFWADPPAGAMRVGSDRLRLDSGQVVVRGGAYPASGAAVAIGNREVVAYSGVTCVARNHPGFELHVQCISGQALLLNAPEGVQPSLTYRLTAGESLGVDHGGLITREPAAAADDGLLRPFEAGGPEVDAGSALSSTALKRAPVPAAFMTSSDLRPPSGVIAQDDPAGLRVRWEPVGGADGYRVYRMSGANGAWELLNRSITSGTTLTDTGLMPGALAYYRVRTVKATNPAWYAMQWAESWPSEVTSAEWRRTLEIEYVSRSLDTVTFRVSRFVDGAWRPVSVKLKAGQAIEGTRWKLVRLAERLVPRTATERQHFVGSDGRMFFPGSVFESGTVTRELEPLTETFAVCESDTGESFELRIRESVRPAPAK